MSNVIATIIKFSAQGASACASAIGGVQKAATVATKGMTTLASSLGSLGGPLGNAASQVANFIFSVRQMGAVGGIIAGAQMAISIACEKIIKSYDKMLERIESAGDKIRNRLEKINASRMDGVNKALEDATTRAQEAAKAFDNMAAAYMKVEKAKVDTEKSEANSALSELTLEKSRAMAGAKNDNERATVGAAYDKKIAREKLKATEDSQSAEVAGAEDERVQAQHRAEMARKAEEKARKAMLKASATYDEDVTSGNEGNAKTSKAARNKAIKAYDDAIQNRIAKEADAEVAEEKLKQAKNNQSAALNEARREVVEAESAAKQLADAQKKSAYMKDIADLEKKAEKKKQDIELTHQQAKAEVDLSIAKAKALGKDKEASNLEMKAKALEAKEKRDLAAASVEAAMKKVSAANGQDAKEVADAKRNLAIALKEEATVNVANKKSMISANGDRRSDLTSEVSRWQGEFDKAFDLWRDPEAAQQAVDADKKRGEDMKAFRKAINRYGGKGKIDEYARLMREGDEEGMQDRLTQWRKSSKFTPQVEQMVKAAAADQNKNAAEKSLAQIEKNTGDLAKKIDELLSLK